MTATTCHGITRQGERCRARPLARSTYCVNHSPEITDEQRKAWAAQGGKNSASRVRARKTVLDGAMTPAELGGLLSDALRRTLAGEIEPGVANAAANLSRAMIVVRGATETEERLDAIEKAVETYGRHTGRYSA